MATLSMTKRGTFSTTLEPGVLAFVHTVVGAATKIPPYRSTHPELRASESHTHVPNSLLVGLARESLLQPRKTYRHGAVWQPQTQTAVIQGIQLVLPTLT